MKIVVIFIVMAANNNPRVVNNKVGTVNNDLGMINNTFLK